MDDRGPIEPYQVIITVQKLSYTVLLSPETGSRVHRSFHPVVSLIVR